jgi:hypothetical protein
MKFYLSLVIGLLAISDITAQKSDSPVKMIQSEGFESPGRHNILSPIPYEVKGILQVNNKR